MGQSPQSNCLHRAHRGDLFLPACPYQTATSHTGRHHYMLQVLLLLYLSLRVNVKEGLFFIVYVHVLSFDGEGKC